MALYVIEFGRKLLSSLHASAGQTLVEYALLIALLSLAVVALATMAFGTNGIIQDIEAQLNSALGL
jgi:Flp pilus assembly pilin Flp